MSDSRNPCRQPPPRGDGSLSSPPETGNQPDNSTQSHGNHRISLENLEERATPTQRPMAMSPMVHDPHGARPSAPRGAVRGAQDELAGEQPPNKRARTNVGSPDRSGGAPSPSSDSQGGMADSEADGKQVEQGSSSSAAPLKKKRTRTLTTPHQSQVLHALLAQSRFPTTAMREEVGRSIGLSARKVQIWFQNQRQKARRPRQQGDVQSTRGGHFGPYPGVGHLLPHSAPSGSYPMMSGVVGLYSPSPAGPSRYAASGEMIHPDRFRHHSVPLVDTPQDDLPRLLGPGVPGSTNRGIAIHRERELEWPASAPATDDHFARIRSRFGSPPPPPTMSPAFAVTRPSTSQPRGLFERDPSRTLPPLIPSRPSTSATIIGLRQFHAQVPTPSRITIPPILGYRRSPSPENRFSHQLPEAHHAAAHVGRPSFTLPPPYTLQPTPQWDASPPTRYTAASRPSSSSWSRPASHSSDKDNKHWSASPPLSQRVEAEASGSTRLEEEVKRLEPQREYDDDNSRTPQQQPQPRDSPAAAQRPLGRYDPVREIFIPFTSEPNEPPPPPPPQRQPSEGAAGHAAADSTQTAIGKPQVPNPKSALMKTP